MSKNRPNPSYLYRDNSASPVVVPNDESKMKGVGWDALRSAAVGYAIRGAIGGAMGAFFGFCGALREAHDSAVPLANARPLHTTVFAATIGCVAGLIFWALRRLRDRGGVYYFLPWGLSVGAGTALVLLPTILKTREWLAFTITVAVSVSAGCGLGAYIYLMFKDQSRE